MAVALTGKHIYVQFIDDVAGKTLAAASTIAAEGKGTKATVAGAKKIGALAAQQAKDKNITSVVFDRGGFRFHGRVKALATTYKHSVNRWQLFCIQLPMMCCSRQPRFYP